MARQRVARSRQAAGRRSGQCRSGSRFCFVGWFIPVFKCTPTPAATEGIRLTRATRSDNLNFMSRFIFAALVSALFADASAAQQVPGRDLLEFPLGLLAEPAALSSRMAGSLWNPASSALDGVGRWQVGFAGLATPQDQGVRLEMVGLEYRASRVLTTSLSFAQASVTDIIRTETDPQSIAGEIPYATTVVSAGAAARRANAAFGITARYRTASLDAERAGVLALDAGAIVDRVAGTPVRLAASSFLFSPSRRKEAATYLAAADLPLFKVDTTLSMRAGYAITHTEGRGGDGYAFGTMRYRQFDASAGLSQSRLFGTTNRRLRLGVGLRYAGYDVALAREDGAAGFGASYQFVLTRTVK